MNSPSAQHLLDLGLKWYGKGRFAEAVELFDAARACAEVLEEPAIAAEAWLHFGRASSLSCEPMVAEHAFTKAAGLFEALGEVERAGAARLRSAFVAYDAGDLLRAEEILEAELRRAQDPSVARGMALGYLANIERSRGALASATRRYQEAIEALQRTEDALYRGVFRMDVAVVHLLEGRWTEAWRELEDTRAEIAPASVDAMLAALLAHYEGLALSALGEGSLASAALDRFEPTRSAAMDFLKSTHGLIRAFAQRPKDPALKAQLSLLRSEMPAYEHARLSLRILRRLLGGTSAPDRRLVIVEAEHRLRIGDELEVEFGARSAEWRLVRALAAEDARVLTTEALIAAGWPGERLAPESARNRLHVALAKLRKRGLRDVLLRYPEGYGLSPGLAVVLLQSESAKRSV